MGLKARVYLYRLFTSQMTLLYTLQMPVSAQIVPDETLPQNSRVNVETQINRIVGGTRTGGNLFHSFREFSVPEGIAAYFDNAPDIENIIARVTGGNVSNIDGILRANGGANLFLINPGGIAFGPNATLELGGSFVASTADSLVFDNGFEFSATNPQAPPLLTINIPIGLQYGPNPGEIRVAGPGNNPFRDPNTFEIIFDASAVGLQVETGKTFALLGGDVTLSEVNIIAPGGKIEIWSGKKGFLSLTVNDRNIAITQDRLPKQLGAIRFNQAASVDVSGNGSGEVQIVGQSIVFSDDSGILANNFGSNDGGLVTVRATESVDILGSSRTNNLTLSNGGISSNTFSTGNSATIMLYTKQLTVSNESFISSGTLNEGNAGNIIISAEEIILNNNATISSNTSTFRTDNGTNTGNGGDVNISTDKIQLSNDATISSTTTSRGNAGNVNISSEQITINGFGTEISSFTLFSTGRSGNIMISAGELTLNDGATISSSIEVGKADAGNIMISSQQLTLSDRATISSGTFRGNAGNITIATEQLILSNALISSGTAVDGNAGNIIISTEQLTLSDWATINVSSSGNGNAGSLTVQAQTVELIDSRLSAGALFAPLFDSLLLNPVSGTRTGGNVNIIADRLIIRDRATVSASNFLSRNELENLGLEAIPPGSVPTVAPSPPSPPSTVPPIPSIPPNTVSASTVPRVPPIIPPGPAGSVRIEAQEILLDNEGTITTEATTGDRGNISLSADDIQLRRGSAVTTNATDSATGGNITINTDNLVALENSDITANAEQSFGGRVSIATRGLFGTEFRQVTSPRSDITATSELGPNFDGTVDIQTPEIDPTSGLLNLPKSVVDAEGLIGLDFCSQSTDSQFIATGRGGLPPNPVDPLSYDTVLLEWWTADSADSTDSANSTRMDETGKFSLESIVNFEENREQFDSPSVIREAQGWYLDSDGAIVLTADPSKVTPSRSRLIHPGC